jgi:hypothetical protein
LVLITSYSCLENSGVKKGLEIMQGVPHRIGAKPDAGTETYRRFVNRSPVSFGRILHNLETTSKQFPLIVQSLFRNIRVGPSTEGIDAYRERLDAIRGGGGPIPGL